MRLEDQFRRLVPAANYDLPSSEILRLLSRISLTRSLYHSWKWHGRVLVGRRSTLRIQSGARLEIVPGGILAIGLAHDGREGAMITLRPRSTLRIGGFVQVFRRSQITVNWGGEMSVGGGTTFAERATIYCERLIEIGDRCAFGWDITLMDTDAHPISIAGRELTRQAPIRIGNHAWIASGAMVLKGVTVGPGGIVAAGAVVTTDVDSRTIVAGSPAKVIARDVDWSMT